MESWGNFFTTVDQPDEKESIHENLVRQQAFANMRIGGRGGIEDDVDMLDHSMSRQPNNGQNSSNFGASYSGQQPYGGASFGGNSYSNPNVTGLSYDQPQAQHNPPRTFGSQSFNSQGSFSSQDKSEPRQEQEVPQVSSASSFMKSTFGFLSKAAKDVETTISGQNDAAMKANDDENAPAIDRSMSVPAQSSMSFGSAFQTPQLSRSGSKLSDAPKTNAFERSNSYSPGDHVSNFPIPLATSSSSFFNFSDAQFGPSADSLWSRMPARPLAPLTEENVEKNEKDDAASVLNDHKSIAASKDDVQSILNDHNSVSCAKTCIDDFHSVLPDNDDNTSSALVRTIPRSPTHANAALGGDAPMMFCNIDDNDEPVLHLGPMQAKWYGAKLPIVAPYAPGWLQKIFRVFSEMGGKILYYNPKNFKKSYQNQPQCTQNAVKI